ncbi:hypothetical protein [Actinokineospora sp.]|uniref:hypothetical protein n=1 Tax=Actinokineospora sp. TaxID=1872133 RepID=UPI0040382093
MITYRLDAHPGKARGLKAITTDGLLSIAALDHRRSFAALYGGTLGYRGVRTLKRRLIDAFAGQASGVLLDPNYGILLDDGHTGLIVTLEAPGHTVHNGVPESALLDGWTVGKAKRIGAAGVKLLLHLDPRTESIFKVEYPGPELVGEIDGIIGAPWAMLSGGADFDVFEAALRRACAAGCSGFVAGRSVWQEIKQLPDTARRDAFIDSTAVKRFASLTSIVHKAATSVWSKVRVEDDLDVDWHHRYGEAAR